MPDKTFLGEFEQMVLLSVLRTGANAYGVTILAELKARTGRRVARGALYTTLDRLERKGLTSSSAGDASASRGGRPRRYYRLTPDGTRALRESRTALLSLWQGVEGELSA